MMGRPGPRPSFTRRVIVFRAGLAVETFGLAHPLSLWLEGLLVPKRRKGGRG